MDRNHESYAGNYSDEEVLPLPFTYGHSVSPSNLIIIATQLYFLVVTRAGRVSKMCNSKILSLLSQRATNELSKRSPGM